MIMRGVIAAVHGVQATTPSQVLQESGKRSVLWCLPVRLHQSAEREAGAERCLAR